MDNLIPMTDNFANSPCKAIAIYILVDIDH